MSYSRETLVRSTLWKLLEKFSSQIVTLVVAVILARILMHHTVIFVTRPELKDMVEEMKMRWAPTLDDALAAARAMGKSSLCFIPNGISVIVKE